MNQARSTCKALSGSFERRFFLRGGAGSELLSSSSSSSASPSSFALPDPAAAAVRDLAREPFAFLPANTCLTLGDRYSSTLTSFRFVGFALGRHVVSQLHTCGSKPM